MPSYEPPATRLTLLGALRQGLRWEEFVALYGRTILGWGRGFGLQDADADNLRQEVLIRVWKGIAAYNPARGRFRGWLYTCTRNAVANLRRAQPRECCPGLVPDVPARLGAPEDRSLDDALGALQDEGFAHADLQAAVARVRDAVQPTTWKAFLLFEFFELTAKEIAPRLQLTPAGVNQAVYRVRQLLQRELRSGPEKTDP